MSESRARALRREQFRFLLWAIPVGAAVWGAGRVLGTFSDRPLGTVLLLAPLLAVIAWLGRPLLRERRLLLGGGFLAFYLVWLAFFALVAETNLLDGRRAWVTGIEETATPANFLGLARLGDWRYRLVPRAPDANDIVIVMVPSQEGRLVLESRRLLAGLIATALENEAKGIVFDFALTQPSEFDAGFCHWVEQARFDAVPVLFAARLRERAGVWVRDTLPAQLRACIRDEQLASAVGVLEADHVLRHVLGTRPDVPAEPAFVMRAATMLGAQPDRARLVRFVEPASGPVILNGVDAAEAELLRDRYLFVGALRGGDVWRTPFGDEPGVVILSWAAHGLRTGHVLRTLPSPFVFGLLAVGGWLLALVQSSGRGRRALARAAAALIVAIALTGALAARFALLWVDIGVPTFAIGVLALTLGGGAALQEGRSRARPARSRAGEVVKKVRDLSGGEAAQPSRMDAGGAAFDVFISYNAEDRPLVLELYDRLSERELRPWLDVWELVPGRPWQEAVEEAIATSRSALVLIGASGIGPWERPEMRACLDQCVQRGMPVIPTLLPGAPEQPGLPLFLTGFTWVDLRDGFADGVLDRLEWGVTGIRPSHAANA